jgi:hypothetical protein
MEEIITVDGKQFKLSTDRPLTALERAQTIAQIRQQTGCGTCGGKAAQLRSMDSGLGYGEIKSMGPCAAGLKGSGPLDDPVSLVAAPDGGVGPYTVKFYIKRNTEAYVLMATGAGTPALGTVTGTNTQTVNEGSSTTAFSYKLIDTDIVAATGDAAAGEPATGTTGAVTDPADTTAPLSAGQIRFATTTVDSCVVAAGGPKYCIEWCDVTITCVAPTCNFTVT